MVVNMVEDLVWVLDTEEDPGLRIDCTFWRSHEAVPRLQGILRAGSGYEEQLHLMKV